MNELNADHKVQEQAGARTVGDKFTVPGSPRAPYLIFPSVFAISQGDINASLCLEILRARGCPSSWRLNSTFKIWKVFDEIFGVSFFISSKLWGCLLMLPGRRHRQSNIIKPHPPSCDEAE